MQILKKLSLSMLLTAAVISAPAYSKSNSHFVKLIDLPAKTICIKHPAAGNVDGFFSTTTVLMFEVYKPGSKEEMTKIINALKKDLGVESCNEGTVTGDFHAVTLTLREMKSKAWFIALFKKVGLSTIKINNNPVVEVEKM